MSILPWILFLLLVFALLALDLGVLNRNIHEISTKEALKWTCFWIGLALCFSGVIYFLYSGQYFGIGATECVGKDNCAAAATMDYLTGYLIEKALSLDNIAVMSMIFVSFGVPLKFQHRVLFWGILGALVFRGIMIGCGSALVQSFDWVLWIFGAVLLYLAIKTTFGGESEEDPQDKWITKFLVKHFRYDPKIDGMHFFRKIDGKNFMTPLIVALVVIEVSDVIFAVDSIPAIFGITKDPFIVFTSNIFAILGLRSLYFVLASILEKFSCLKYSVGAILLFVAVKLLIPAGFEIANLIGGTDYKPIEFPNWSSLAFVAGAIAIGIIVSILRDKNKPKDIAEEKAENSEKAEEKSEEKKEDSNSTEEKAEDKKEDSEKSEEHPEDKIEDSEKAGDKKDDSASPEENDNPPSE